MTYGAYMRAYTHIHQHIILYVYIRHAWFAGCGLRVTPQNVLSFGRTASTRRRRLLAVLSVSAVFGLRAPDNNLRIYPVARVRPQTPARKRQSEPTGDRHTKQHYTESERA